MKISNKYGETKQVKANCIMVTLGIWKEDAHYTKYALVKKKQGHRFTTINLFHLTKLTKYNETWLKAKKVWPVGRSPSSPIIIGAET